MSRAPIHRLPGLGVLRLEGRDALAFLQGQVTADLRPLEPGQAARAAWCTPQGRVIALLDVLRLDGELLCVLPGELAAEVTSGLARFILRSKVSITDLSATLSVAGVDVSPGDGLAASRDVYVLPLPAERSLVVASPSQLESMFAGAPPAAAGSWDANCIRLGEPAIYRATSESWVPQMLNLDLLGAVSFSKGCYPGQEIVARTQNLGRIKRRLFRYRVSGPALPAPGDGLHAGGPRVGEVVRSARLGEVAELLAVVGLDAAAAGLTTADGSTSCFPEPLPYAVPEAPALP